MGGPRPAHLGDSILSMLTIQQWLSAAVALVCLALLMRLLVGAPRRARIDRRARQAWTALRDMLKGIQRRARIRRTAKQAAREAIERARHGVERRGNVYTPKSFSKPRKPE